MKLIEVVTFSAIFLLLGETEEAEICRNEKDDKFEGSKNVSNSIKVHSPCKISCVVMCRIVKQL